MNPIDADYIEYSSFILETFDKDMNPIDAIETELAENEGEDCDSYCKTCGLSPSMCLSCGEDEKAYLFENACLDECPREGKGTYSDHDSIC